jgi:hypothetical protein
VEGRLVVEVAVAVAVVVVVMVVVVTMMITELVRCIADTSGPIHHTYRTWRLRNLYCTTLTVAKTNL